MKSIEVTEENFNQEVLESDVPVLVDFYTPWCVPCQSMLSIIERIDENSKGKYKVRKVNIEKNTNLSLAYRIRSIPTFKVFKKGEVVDTKYGMRPERDLLDMIGGYLDD